MSRHPHPPKAFFVENVQALRAGAALDVGCGPGAEAIWLASCGWTVTALDVSAAALERARAADIERRVTWLEQDFMTWPLPAGGFDLGSAHFVHVEPSVRAAFFEKLTRAVRPGGHLSFASHHPSDVEKNVGRPPHADLYFTPEEVVAHLAPDRWQTIESGTRPGHAHHRDGRAIEIVDTVVFARRLA